MRTAEELEKVAFREKLTAEEDDLLVDHFLARSAAEPTPRVKSSALKQAAFFAGRAFEKGARSPEQIKKYSEILTSAQKIDPSDNFRRKLNEMKSALKGKDGYEATLKKLARKGTAYTKDVLATDEQLDQIESSLGVKLPASYRHYLKTYAHREIGTYEPYTAADLTKEILASWDGGIERYLLPFLEDNADHFCFDLRTGAEEPPVVFRPHDGTSKESWPNFVAWVEECWLAELDE